MTRVGAAPLVGQDADQVVLACSTVQYGAVWRGIENQGQAGVVGRVQRRCLGAGEVRRGVGNECCGSLLGSDQEPACAPVSWPAKAAGSSSGFAAAALLPPSASFMWVSPPAGPAAAALPLAAVAAAPALPAAVAAAAVPSSSFCFLLSPTRRSSISLAAPPFAGREEGKKTGETGEGRPLSSSSTADLASGLAEKLQQLRPPAGVLLRAAAARRPLLACQAGALELGLQRGRAELQGIKHQREGDLRQGAAAMAGRHGRAGGQGVGGE